MHGSVPVIEQDENTSMDERNQDRNAITFAKSRGKKYFPSSLSMRCNAIFAGTAAPESGQSCGQHFVDNKNYGYRVNGRISDRAEIRKPNFQMQYLLQLCSKKALIKEPLSFTQRIPALSEVRPFTLRLPTHITRDRWIQQKNRNVT